MTEPNFREQIYSQLNWIVLAVGLVSGLVAILFLQTPPKKFFLGLAAALITASAISLLQQWAAEEREHRPRLHPNAESVRFHEFVLSAKHNLQTSAITLEKALDEFIALYGSWTNLKHKTEHELSVELLFCHPNNTFLHERTNWEFGNNEEKLIHDAWLSIAKSCMIAKFWSQHYASAHDLHSARLKIELIKEHPITCTTFRCDDTIITGPYLSCGEGSKTLRLQIHNNVHPDAFRDLQSDFTHLWGRGTWLVQLDQRVQSINLSLLADAGLPHPFDFAPCWHRCAARAEHEALFRDAKDYLIRYHGNAASETTRGTTR